MANSVRLWQFEELSEIVLDKPDFPLSTSPVASEWRNIKHAEKMKLEIATPKTQPVIRLESPPSGAIPATLEQLTALGFTAEEIEAGEKRLESVHSGPWSICRSLRGIVERAEFGEYSRKTWVEFYPARTMSNPRPCGYDMEGTISLAGRKSSAFTSSQLFELPDGRLVDCEIIFARI